MRLLSTCDLDRQPSPLPLRIANVQPPRLQTATAQQAHRVVGIDAVGATAVGDDLAALRQLADKRVERVDGRRPGAGDMAGAKLCLRANVEHDHIATLEPPCKLLGRELLYSVSLP